MLPQFEAVGEWLIAVLAWTFVWVLLSTRLWLALTGRRANHYVARIALLDGVDRVRLDKTVLLFDLPILVFLEGPNLLVGVLLLAQGDSLASLAATIQLGIPVAWILALVRWTSQ